MRRIWLVLILTLAAAAAEALTLSVDPVTFVGLLPASGEEEGESDLRNLWFCAELSGTFNESEAGLGVFLRADRFALRAQWRRYFNKEQQSGVFWGFYGLIEYRKMFWFYDEEGEIGIGYSFPFKGGKVYHSAGVSAGADAGFRLRIGNVGITPYIGLGFPLFAVFGDKPPDEDSGAFRTQNALLRAVDAGLRIDFFM